MSQVRQFIDQLASGESSAAKESLENMISSKAFEALDVYKKEMASSIFGGSQVEEPQEEFELDEATMTHIKLGRKVRDADGGYNQNVHYKNKKIGHIEAYKDEGGHMRYGAVHHETGNAASGNRDSESAVDDLRAFHADHIKDMK